MPPDYVPDIDAFPLLTTPCVMSNLRVAGSDRMVRVVVVAGESHGFYLARKIKDCIMGAVYAATNCAVQATGDVVLGRGV